MKQTGMLVVSLRGENFGFWSCLGCFGQSVNILCRQGLVQGSAKKHRLDCRIPGPLIYISLNKNITIVIYLVLQSTPTHVNKWAGYSAIAPKHSITRRETEVKFSFQIEAFDDYVFISLKRIACSVCVFLSGLFQGSKICLSHAQIGLLLQSQKA